jgi:glucose/arabinose dehydrogenase
MALAAPVPAFAAVPMSPLADGFSQPLYMTHAGDSRLFVVEKGGLVKIVGGGTFLDKSAQISTNGERGLLGLAFDPKFATNGLFYIYYTRPDGDIVIAERRVSSGNRNVADPNYERVVLVIEHSGISNHNGGWIGFNGKLLFIAVGDGGDDGHGPQRAQDRGFLRGKILRINPHDPPGAARYTIPRSNPFVGRRGRDEIWAYGLRNPWRCSHDRALGILWCGDVGESDWEEIDRGPMRGLNLGWGLLEGSHYYQYPGKTPGDPCTANCRTLPLLEFRHVPDTRGAVVGGYVSRRPGAAMEGKYVFGDMGTGRIWVIPATFQRGDSLPAPAVDTELFIYSFAEGANGMLYVIDGVAGAIYTLDDS